MTHTHEAGALHATAGVRAPSWLAPPDDVNALVPKLWSQGVARNATGELELAGVGVAELAKRYGTPLFVVDELDVRERARAFREAFSSFEIFYASKAFCSAAVIRWVAEEGLSIDVCSAGELAVALKAGVAPERIGLHGNNKTEAELQQAIDLGLRRVVVDSFDEIARLRALTAGRSRARPLPVMVRATAGVEAHTHEYIATAHEDQKFGLSISEGETARAAMELADIPGLDLRGIHSHIGSQIFDTSGFEVAARRVLAEHTSVSKALGRVLPEVDLGGGFGIAYTTQDEPSSPQELADGLQAIVDAECHALGIDVPHLSIEPGRAIVGPAAFTLYTIGTVKPVVVSRDATRLYISVDGGMSDNIRTALYNAEYSACLAGRASEAPPRLSRVVGKHCESGDIVVMDEFLPSDLRPGDLLAVPGTGAYCRSMASNYNQAPRPAVVAVNDGNTRLIMRRETVDDLLALDVG
jgi:diaminopimelate decarboxylase